MTVFEYHQEQYIIDTMEINSIAAEWGAKKIKQIIARIESLTEHYYLLDNEELIEGILSFWKERGYVTKKQKWCVCWAIGYIEFMENENHLHD